MINEAERLRDKGHVQAQSKISFIGIGTRLYRIQLFFHTYTSTSKEMDGTLYIHNLIF